MMQDVARRRPGQLARSRARARVTPSGSTNYTMHLRGDEFLQSRAVDSLELGPLLRQLCLNGRVLCEPERNAFLEDLHPSGQRLPFRYVGEEVNAPSTKRPLAL